MFKLQPKPTFKIDVTIPRPEGDGKIKFEFRHKGRKAMQGFMASLGEGETARKDSDALFELIEGWEGVDEKYSAEALESLLDNYHGSAQAIFAAYNKGLFEGGQKN